jgi:hypothetical protein
MKKSVSLTICAISLVALGIAARAPNNVTESRSVEAAALDSPALQAQAPGWSRGQQNLAISYDECMRRAPAALSAEGYRRDDQPGGNFAVGIKGVHTAVIICSPAPEAKMLVHIVVASNGDGGGLERQRLQAQMERPGAVVSGGCGLGRRWDETEEGWTAIWTRRGNSNVFDLRATKGGMTLTAVQTISINGNRVSVRRTNVSDGNDCEMEGTIAEDGVTVTGTYRCRSGGPYAWRATIRCQ